MTTSRSKRHIFRPCLGEGPLEARVVPSTTGTVLTRTHESLVRAHALNSLEASLSGRQLRHAVLQQVRAATVDARRAINAQVAQLYAHGRPTAQQKADFLAMSGGILDATALRLSSIASLLPQGSTQLVPGIQGALLGSQNASLTSRIERAVESDRVALTSRSLESAITQAVNRATNQRVASFGTFLSSPGLAARSVDASGQAIPLSQFIGNQLIGQVGNTLGSLSQSFPTVADAMLFADGTTTATAATQQAFAAQYLSALGLTASQLSSGLALAPSLASTLAPQLQSALFATGPDSPSLFSALQGLPTTSEGFGAAASTAFTNAFQGLTSPLSAAFNLPASQTFTLPTANIPSLFGSQFSGLGNGFNNGFGSNFPGFGAAAAGSNTNFATGFNNAITGLNTGFGFTLPTLATAGSTTGSGGVPGPLGGPGTGLR